jgi:hypothetical protein
MGSVPAEERPIRHRPRWRRRAGSADIQWQPPAPAWVISPAEFKDARTYVTQHEQPTPEQIEETKAPEPDLQDILRTGIPEGRFVALAPGMAIHVTDDLTLPESRRQAIFIGCGQVVVQDFVHGMHMVHLRMPGSPGGDGDGAELPVVAKVVVVVIRRRRSGGGACRPTSSSSLTPMRNS